MNEHKINSKSCEGGCSEHEGEVITVTVSSEAWSPTKYNYCQKAVNEDLRRGFKVEQPEPKIIGEGEE